MNKIGIRQLLYKRAIPESRSLSCNMYTLIVTCLMLTETVIVTLYVSNNLVVTLVAISGLVVIWGFIKIQRKQFEKDLIDDEVKDYTNLISSQTPDKEVSTNHHYPMTTTDLLLSDRELQILRQIANGNSNKQTAIELNISQQTVKNHLKHIFSKLEVNDRTSAVLLAMNNGWINNQKRSE